MSKHPQGTGTVTAQYSVADDQGSIVPTSIGFLHEQFAGFYFKTADGHEVLLEITWQSRPALGQYHLSDPSGSPYGLKVAVDNTKLETGTLQIDAIAGGPMANIRGSFTLTTDPIAHYQEKMTITCDAFDIHR